MNFEFSTEQKLIQQTIRDFGQKEIKPLLRKIDGDEKIPFSIIQSLSRLGFLGITVAKEYGGAEVDPITTGIIAEELAKADITCAIPTFFLVQAAWGYVLNKYGRESIKSEILPKITQGTAFLGIAATEPDTGSDLANMRTNAIKKDDKYIISGEKMFISGINEITNYLPDGGGYVMLAKTEPARGTRGISLFYIPIKKLKGVATTVLKDWGRKGISTGGFAMENVELPADYLVGEENKGFYIAMEGFDYARANISLVACGVALSCLEQAMEHIKKRTAFGQPLGKFEGVQFKLAEHWSRLEASRLLGYKALWMYGKEQKEKLFTRFEVTKVCAAAKLSSVPSAFEAINDALQWFGAFGYTTDCPLELALKGVRSYYWAEGALEIMRIIVARELLGKEFIAYR